MRYSMTTILLAALSASTSCSNSEVPDSKTRIESPSVRVSTQRGTNAADSHTSPWGQEVHGLQSRVMMQEAIEQNMALEVAVEFRCLPENPLPGVKVLNKYLWTEHFILEVVNIKTNESFIVETDDPTMGMPPPPDSGEYTIPLDGSPIDPFKLAFRLVRLRDQLVPGQYECRVKYATPPGPPRGWRGTREDWDGIGYWSGAVVSGSCRLDILPETPKTRTFLLPTRLRLVGRQGTLRITYKAQDAEEVTTPVRNGHFVVKRVTGGGSFMSLGPPPVPDDVNPIAWFGSWGGDRDVSYTITLFETCKPGGHLVFWGPSDCGYKVLWERTFDLHFTADGIKDIRCD